MLELMQAAKTRFSMKLFSSLHISGQGRATEHSKDFHFIVLAPNKLKLNYVYAAPAYQGYLIFYLMMLIVLLKLWEGRVKMKSNRNLNHGNMRDAKRGDGLKDGPFGDLRKQNMTSLLLSSF